jgi:hypothetical protein
VATRIDIEPSTLHGFVREGSTVRPKAKVLEPILRYVQNRSGSSPRPSEHTTTGPAGGGAGGMSVGPTVTVSRDHLMEWRGQLKVMLRWLRAIGESAQQIHDELGEAADGVAEILDSGVLPAPALAVHPAGPPTLTPEEALALYRDALRAAGRDPGDGDGGETAGGSPATSAAAGAGLRAPARRAGGR